MNRRRFLRVSILSGVGAALGGVGALVRFHPHKGRLSSLPRDEQERIAETALPGRTPGPVLRWSDPATWAGSRPGPTTLARVRRRIVLDVNARVAGLEIQPGGELLFDPAANITLSVSGNIVVQGKLTMHPRDASVTHKLAFLDVNEGRFVGQGTAVLLSDVGLWVMDDGILDIVGAEKRPWTRAVGEVRKGARSITLSDEPAGWRPDDELVIAPTLDPRTPDHHLAYDDGAVVGVSGRTVKLSRAAAFDHPAVEVKPQQIMTAEVMNLTRNVRLEGTPGGRAHVFIHSRRPQTMRYAALRYMGPRRGGQAVLGRYGVHFHLCGPGSRGSIIEGVVVRQAGNHAFVPHESHGITFRGCISHDTFEEAYWWDRTAKRDSPVTTNNTLWDRCVASMVQAQSPKGHRLAGFVLGPGSGNTSRDCVAIGVGGLSEATGFQWPETKGVQGIWAFHDAVAHNNKHHGSWTWQNLRGRHVIQRLVGYHNGQSGIFHGAYANQFDYRDCVLYGNRDAAVTVKASSMSGLPLRFTRMWCDGAGFSDYVFQTQRHALPAAQPTIIASSTFLGYRKAAVGLTSSKSRYPDDITLSHCSFRGNELWLDSDIARDSRVQLDPSVRSARLARPKGERGALRPEWNAVVSS